MQHYFYGGDKDGLECGSMCRELLVTADPDKTAPDLYAANYVEIRWIHTVYYPEDRTKEPKHYYVREDLLRRLETIL